MESLRRFAIIAAVIGAAVCYGLSLDGSLAPAARCGSLGTLLLLAAVLLLAGGYAAAWLRSARIRRTLPEAPGLAPAILHCNSRGFKGFWTVHFSRTRAVLRDIAGQHNLTVQAAFTGRLVSLPAPALPGVIRIKAEGKNLEFSLSGSGLWRLRRWLNHAQAAAKPTFRRRSWQTAVFCLAVGAALGGVLLTYSNRFSPIVEEFGAPAGILIALAVTASLALVAKAVAGIIFLLLSQRDTTLLAQIPEEEDDAEDEKAKPAERKRIPYGKHADAQAPPRRTPAGETNPTPPDHAPERGAEQATPPPQADAGETKQPVKAPPKGPERRVIPLRKSAPPESKGD